jgi:galactoside O-acetyltransferase
MDNKYGFKNAGENIIIYDPISLIHPEKMVLKSHIMLSEFSYLASGKGLFIGNFTHISTHCSILGGGFCIINDFVGVTAGTRLITGSESILGNGISCGPMIPPEFRDNFQSYIIIEKHAFIGTNVVILPGITIGEGAVIAAGSIIKKNIEPWGIYSGSPARRIGTRPKSKILQMEATLVDKYSIELSDFSQEEKIARATVNDDILLM